MTERVDFHDFISGISDLEKLEGIVLRIDSRGDVTDLHLVSIYHHMGEIAIHYKYFSEEYPGPHRWSIRRNYCLVSGTPFRDLEGRVILPMGYFDDYD